MSLASSAHANLLRNGSFEAGTLVNKGQQTMSLAPGSIAITRWTVITDTVALIDGGNPFGLSAFNGSRFLDLTDYAFGAQFGGVQQTVLTSIGSTYLLSFYLGSSDGEGRPSAITASAGNVAQTLTSATTGTSTWELRSMSFVAISTSTVISLVGPVGQNYIDLDNVALIVTAVLEPTAAALLCAALNAIGAWRRRSNN